MKKAVGHMPRKACKGAPVWFEFDDGLLAPGVVHKSSSGNRPTVVRNLLDNKLYSIMDPGTLRARDPGGEVGIEDLTQLDDLHEGAILLNLKKRYDSEHIYTYIGSILLSLNPYRMYDIYSSEVVLLYEGKAMGDNPPHLFSIANAAYMKMVDAKENQCILISGESGSGKTEATKLVLRYVAALNHTRKDNITQQILEATPLLESFGNAKTMRNDNSSRFGKYIQLFMEDGVINGAITSQYLLEKSRIVFQAKNERNYHIFYELLAGLPSQQRQRYYLQDPETYYYLNQGGNCEIPGKHDGEDFRRLLSALEILTFSTDDQATIFKVLSSILHLGNVCFACHEVDGQEVASVVSVRELQSVSELLQISQEGLQKAITYKVTEAMREKIYTPLSVESAIDARDAIAKILYAQLFVWLISHINLLVAPRQDAKSIAVLDIYGFEDLAMNSFEQLCINYANEYLQYFFNRIIFRQEQEVYDRERISWKHITFNDNQACLDLISQKPYGIMRILDDQSAFPQATDQTFLQKCHYHHGNNPLYSKPKMPLPEFTIKHYAGKVTYQVHKFLDKNFDQVRQEVLELLIHSKCKLMSDQFRQHQSVAQGRMGKNCSLGRRYQAPTVAAKFQQSLMELIEKMEKCNPFFVRCIKPNHRKEPGLFDAEVVGAQLLYLGILETIRIRKEGYPVRVPFHTFTCRYKMLVGRKEAVASGREGCVTILSKISIKKRVDEPYQIGINRVFLKEKLHQALESRRERVLHWAAVTMQRYARGFVARRRYHRMRSKVILLQAHIRGYQARYRYKMIREGFIRLRATVLMFLCRRRYLKARDDDRRRAEMEGKSWKAGPRREGVNVSQLEIPAELAAVLQASRELQHVHDGHVVITCQPPISQTLQPTLPLDVNNFPFSKFARIHFKDQQFGVLTSSPRSPITLLEEDLRSEAVELLKLVMRFMGSSDLDSLHEFLFGCYVVQRGLACVRLRDELLCQLANQTWHNEQPREEEQGWLLMAACLSSFSPSPRLEKYLLKYVSDHAYNGYRATCQHKLLQGMSANSVEPGASRTFPPCLLEWVAAKNHAAMALEVACHNGETLLCPVESWTTGEQLGASILQRRGASESCRGWSVSLQQGARTNELPGHEHVLDLVSHLELPPSFPTQTCSFLPPQHNSGHGKDSSGGSAYETDEDMPFPPRAKAPPHPPASLSDSDGYFSRPYSPESETNSDQRSQKTMDQYLDSLFDPVLSFGAADMERAAALNRQLKGGGRVGPGSSSQPNPQAAGPPPQQTPVGSVVQVMPGEMVSLPGIQAMVMSPDVMAQQQALLQQQAYLLAQQMALQMMYQHKPGSEPNAATSSPAAAGDGNNAASGVAEQSSYPHQDDGEWEGRMRPLQPSRDYRPEPTQNIRNIIKEFHTQPASTLTPPAEPQSALARRGTGKAFVKKPDPHMEAMAILQMKPRAPDLRGCGHALQRKRSQIAEARAALGSRDDPPAFKPPPPPFSDSRRSLKTKRGVSVRFGTETIINREDSGLGPIEPEEERVETQLHQLPTDHTYIYSKVPWKILLRKEVFYPKESLNNPMVVNLLFKQVVHDTFAGTCLRITPGEREKMKSMLADCRVGPDASSADELLKKRVIMAARDNWATYFARLFPATGSAGTEVQMLGVSHKGVKLLVPHRARPSDPPQLRVLHSYSYADVLFVTLLDAKTLEFMLSRDKLLLFSPKAVHVKAMVDHFITELKKDSNYVVAVRSYSTEDRSLLSFHKGDLIRLLPLDGLEPGWRFGMRNGRSGLFPAEYVTPAAPPEYEHLSDRPTGVLSAAGSNVADLDRGTETSSVASEYTDSLDDCVSVASEDGGYTMLDFAKKFFREAQANQNGARGKLRKEKAPTDPSEMVKYTKSPIQESLIHSQDPKFNKLAVEAFLAVMKFMGDYPLKGQGEVDSVFSLLKFSENQPEMRDEIYCHIVKQITSNKSPKPDSCHRGWRLLYIVTAYSKCSDNLKPYLLRYLREVANDSKASFQGMARVCEQHLRRTLQVGGRTQLPSSMELKALVAGRNSKRQLILLPGAIERHVKIKTNSTVQDVIEEICQEMGLHRQEAQEEFAIFLVTNRGESVRPLQKKEYILDVSSEAEKVDEMHRFWFRRIVWVRPLKFDNELYISMHFNQILPEYMNGLFLVLTAGRIDDQLTQQVAKLAALQHRIKGSDYQPTQREVGEYIPAQVLRMQRPQSWLGVVLQHSAQVQALSAHQARAQFMGLASALPLFGSAFFFVQSSSNTAITTPCILAVNQQGLSFLNSITHEVLVSFPMQEVQSTRTQRPTQGETIPYVEIMLGNLMSQRIMQLQLQQGMELCRVIAMHQEILLAAREKRHSLPPSDITIL
ncbi:unconventional myosin-XV isoform X2 [Petromyzon marinus]|uniref:unconventional myosin-XV isoform X2 n=1 Tax=Petromyzon marinus TaxID=7757 RepID=UPI003F6FA395